jgi:hypothetical protein
MNILGSWPSLDGLNFLGVRTNALSIKDMPQKLNLLLSKSILGFTHVKHFTLEHFQNQTHVRLMLSFSLGENQDVIDIYNNKLPDIYGWIIEFITV